MQTLPQLQRGQTDSLQLALNDVALEAKKTSWLLGFVAMICVVLVHFAERSATDSARMALKLCELFDKIGCESSVVKALPISAVVPQAWNRAKSFFHSVFSVDLRRFRFGVSAPSGNSFWSRVKNLSLGFYLGAGSVGSTSGALGLNSIGRQKLSPTSSDLFSVATRVLALVGAVGVPLCRSAFRFLHADSLSHRLSPFMPRTDVRSWTVASFGSQGAL